MKTRFRTQAFSGISWTISLRLIAKLIGYIKLIILARLLTPADFGQFGIALLILTLTETFTETGINEALLQRKKITKPDLSSAWLVQLIRGIILSATIFLLHSQIAHFFSVNPNYIKLISIVPLIRGVTNPGIVLWRKKLKFQNEVGYQLAASIIDLTIAIAVSLSNPNPWALIIGFVSGVIGQAVLSYLAPKSFTRISKESLKRLFNFGKWININSILSYLTHEGDDLLVAKMLSANQLGLYQTAYKFSLLPATQVTSAVSLIGYPIITNQPSNQKKLERNIKFAWVIAYPAFLIGAVLFLFPSQIIDLTLGKEWGAMAPILQLLIIYGTARALGGVLGWYFPAIGKPRINTQINTIKFLVMASVILPLLWWKGIIGVAVSIVIAALVANLLQIHFLSREKGFKTIRILVSPLKALCTSVIVTQLLSLMHLPFHHDLILRSSIFFLVFTVVAIADDNLLRDLLIQEALPRLPRKLRNFLIKLQLQIKRKGWHDFNWRQNVKHATNRDWQERYDKQWLYDRHDSLLPSDTDWIKHIFANESIRTVLEIGPGTGHLNKLLNKAGYQVSTIDISQVVLNELEDPKVPKAQARAEQLPFKGNSFDAIVATHLLEHVDNLHATVADWIRVARIGLCIIVPKEEKPDVAANYHLQFFDTSDKLVESINLKKYTISSHTNPIDATKYLRYWGYTKK